MCLIASLYQKKFVCRYDKQVGVPYYSVNDFPSLKEESYSSKNSRDDEISYFFYYYPKYQKDKIILFLPGIGPGHYAYFAEINELAKRGYRVLTLDYTGTGYSKGKNMKSLNEPTRDVMDLLDRLKLKEEVILMGHSLGGYTSLNVSSLRDEIKTVVVLSPLLSIKSLMSVYVKSKFVVSRILSYEKKVNKEYFSIDLVEYLKTTNKNILYIQSNDDNIVVPNISLDIVKGINNPHLQVIELTKKYHNPNYTLEAVSYMNEALLKYNELVNKKKIKTSEDSINYFKDVSLEKMTTQDEEVFDSIISFIKK